MNFAIVDLVHTGHYTLIESLTKILCYQVENLVTIYTQQKGYPILKHLEKEYPARLSFVIINSESFSGVLEEFLKIKKRKFNRVFVTTIDRSVLQYAIVDFGAPLDIVIHDIDSWFRIGFRSNIKRVLTDAKQTPPDLGLVSMGRRVAKSVLHNFWYANLRKILLKKALRDGGRVIVLTERIKEELCYYLDQAKIYVIPFAVYNENLVGLSQSKTKVRVCIPGFVSQTRRDYFGTLEMIKANLSFYRSGYEFDFLGGVNKNEKSSLQILDKIKELENLGLQVFYYNKDLVGIEEFDKACVEADLILGNTNIYVSETSSYGKTKESGTPFTMIKYGKPGLLPRGYNTIPELQSSLLIYSGYEELNIILRRLFEKPEELLTLKQAATLNAKKFSPGLIYRNIVNL